MRSTVACVAVASMLLSSCGRASEWHQGEGFRWRELTVPESTRVGFTRMPDTATGVSFANAIDHEAAAAQRALFNGSGVAAGDVDGNGYPDLYFAGVSRANVLYLNEGGLRFREADETGGATGEGLASAGATFADTDGDVDLDLILTAVGDLRLYTNDGRGRFEDTGAAHGITSTSGTTSVALSDIEGDGDLDLYVATARRDTIRDAGAVTLQRVGGQLQIPPALADRLAFENGKLTESGEADELFINDGTGVFRLESWTGGRFLDEAGAPLVKPPFDWGLAVAFHDVNDDGFPDLYVCNDFATPDRFYINDGAGNFREIARQAVRTISATSMGVDFADIDRDGDVDFFVDDMLSPDLRRRNHQMPALEPELDAVGVLDLRSQVPRNTLLVSRGDGSYAEAANLAGVDASDWAWATAFVDVDLDGYEDLLVVNGHPFDMQDMDATAKQRRLEGTETQRLAVLEYPVLKVPNVAYRNRGDLTFEQVSEEWGFGDVGISHGLALADLDGDGDLDVATNNLDEPAGIYRNDGAAPRVAVRLEGRGLNTRGIGARVSLRGGKVPVQRQEMIAGGRYLSGSEPLLVFAAAGGPMDLEVAWPGGWASYVPDVQPNTLVVITQPDSTDVEAIQTETPPTPVALFEDVSDRIAHHHHEDGFDDFAVQPLIPRRLSILGPGVAWVDLDGSGTDDLVVGAGRGGSLGVFMGDGAGSFSPVGAAAKGTATTDTAEGNAPTDIAGMAPWNSGAVPTLLVATTSLESSGALIAPSTNWPAPGSTVGLGPDGATSGAAIAAAGGASPGPLAVADIEGDGDLDLFVGGRTVPGGYPAAAPSLIFRQGGTTGGLVADEQANSLLANVGLVSGAVWTDLTADGLPELVLAREWGPPAVFANDGGTLSDATGRLGLTGLTGWWNGVAAGDLDEDGAIDLVLTNWGRNTEYQPTSARPIAILYGDLNGDGAAEIVETRREPTDGAELPTRRIEDLGRAFPAITERVTTFAAYAATSIDELLPDETAQFQRIEVTTLDSTVLLNRGASFEAHLLPVEAQLAPAFGASLADFDGDGHLDLFLAQNYSGQQPRLAAANAGRGLLLAGGADGTFRALSAAESGVLTYADGRGSAVADFDSDGRPDLVVGQNATSTLLLKNIAGAPGVRVRLSGPPGNPAGIGAALRGSCTVAGSVDEGPVVEVHGGSGYWSTDSPVTVLPMPRAGTGPSTPSPGTQCGQTRVWVRWPGGAESEYPLPAGAKDVRVSPAGVEVVR